MSGNQNPLSAASLLRLMAESLPTPSSSSPQIKNQYDAIALAVHACMIAVGYRLVGLDEDTNLPESTSESKTISLPAEWNAYSTISFRYAHSQSSMQFVVRVSRLGSSVTVDAVALGHDKRTSFDVLVQDYISKSAVPATPIIESSAADSEQSRKAIQDIFISEHRLVDLATLVKDRVISKLTPGLHKEGYEESSNSATSTTTPSQARDNPPPSRPVQQPRPADIPNPLRDDRFPPRVPAPGEQPPGFEDEYEILQPHRGGGLPASPFGHIGSDDLNPPGLGLRDPLFAGGVPGRQPMGMYPSPDDILRQGGHFGGQEGAGSSRVPFGARYDPTFPGDPHDPDIRRGGGGFGGPGNPFGGGGGGPFGSGSGFPGGGFI